MARFASTHSMIKAWFGADSRRSTAEDGAVGPRFGGLQNSKRSVVTASNRRTCLDGSSGSGGGLAT